MGKSQPKEVVLLSTVSIGTSGVFFCFLFLLCRPLSPDLDRAGRDADGNV